MGYLRIISLFLLLSLLACQSNPLTKPVVAPTEMTNLSADNRFIVWGLSGIDDVINTYVMNIFQERHPEMEIIVLDQGWDEALRQNLENAILIGRPPDVVIGENYFRYFASRGEMLSVDSLIEKYGTDLIPATYAAAVYENSVYAIPFMTGIFAFERNCAVIAAANLDCDNPPQYWDELLLEAVAITESGLGDYYGYTLQGPGGTAVGAAFRIAVYQAQLDALPCADAACTIPDFNQEAVIPVYEFIRKLGSYTAPGLLTNPNEGEVYEVLFRGVSAYQMAGSWHPAWAETTGCEDCRYSSVPFPREGHAANLVVGNVMFGIPSASPHPELALEWLDLMLSADVQEMVYPSLGRFPVRRSSLEALSPAVEATTAVFINELLTNTDIRILPQWADSPRAIWTIYNQLLEGILLTDRPIADLMLSAESEVEALLGR